MLELIQKRFQTIVLALIVAMLSTIFIVQFGGPQASGCTQSLTNGGTGFAARVYGRTLTNGDFHAAYAARGFTRVPIETARAMRLRELTLEGMVERELLAHQAELMGFTASDEEVLREIAEDQVLWSTAPVDAPPNFGPSRLPMDFTDRDGNFSARIMTNIIQHGLRRSVAEFTAWQVRERLAEQARRTVVDAVVVSEQEVRDQYVRDTDRAKLRYVRFNPTYYRERIEPTDAEITAWRGEHGTEVDAEFDRQRHRYTDLEPQVRARHILIKASEDAPADQRDAARARAMAILARVQGGEDFSAVARETSEDTGSARRGGDLGWNPRGRMVAPFDEAQFALEPGSITPELVETQFGFHIIRSDGRREGDVPEDEAKLEVARDLFVRARAGELARQDADRALAYLREGHSMDELDTRLAWSWQDPPAAGADGAVPQPPERETSAPQVAETRSFGPTEAAITGPVDSGPLTRAAFQLTMDEPLPSEPMQLGDSWFVYQLTERVVAGDEGFTDEVRERIRGELLAEKRTEALRLYVRALRAQAEEDGELRTSDSAVRYGDEEDEQPAEDEGGSDETAEPEGSGGEEESALPRRRGGAERA